MNQQDTTDVFSKITSSSKQTVSGLFSDKKRMAIATAAVLAGGTALAWGLSREGGSPFTTEPGGPAVPTVPTDSLAHGQTLPVTGGTITPTAEVQIGVVNDSLSFDEAFQAARAQTGPGGVFTWHGQVYNTYQKEEWLGLSLAQRQEFLADVGFKPTPPATPATPTNENLLDESPAILAYAPPALEPEPEPIDGFVNGQRVIGYDFDGDGMVDALVMPSQQGRELRIIDADGDDGLDRAVTVDVYTGEVLHYTKLNDPWYLPNNDLQEGIDRSDELTGRTSAEAMSEQSMATYTAASHDLDETDEDDATPDYQNDADNEL